MDTYGIISLVPVIVVVVVAIITKRTFEPMILGGVLGFIILAGKNFFTESIDAMYGVLTEQNTVWIVMLFVCFGGMVALFEKSKSAIGFGNLIAKVGRGRKSSLICTWILGIVVFADDYLNALAVGVAMKNLTDKYRVPRTLLAYVIASTGASVCCILPFATWSAYMMGLMEKTGVVSNGYSAYLSTMPFLAYAWVSLLVVPLVIFRVVPLIGPVRKDDKYAADTGVTLPAGIADVEENAEMMEGKKEELKKGVFLTFLVPIVVLAIVTIITGDMLIGVLIGLFLTIAMVAVQRLMKAGEICETISEGMKDMLPGALIVIAAFFLQAANNGLGMTEFVIYATEPVLSPKLFPFLVFIFMSLLAFGSGSFWGVAAIAFPIILPLAESLGVNIFLASGALVSATVFGSQACFFSDCATIVCMATDIRNSDYARSTLPMFYIPFGITAIIFLILGFIF